MAKHSLPRWLLLAPIPILAALSWGLDIQVLLLGAPTAAPDVTKSSEPSAAYKPLATAASELAKPNLAPVNMAPGIEEIPVARHRKYPGTLADQVLLAVSSNNGQMAYDLSRSLFDCPYYLRLSKQPSKSNGSASETIEAQRARVERLQEEQRRTAECQTLVGDLEKSRTQLLNVAYSQKILGAAVDLWTLGDRRDEVRRQLIADASDGDSLSVTFAAGSFQDSLSMTEQEQRPYRYALYMASKDSTLGAQLQPSLRTAEYMHKAATGDDSRTFDYAGMSQDEIAKGAAIARRLLEQAAQAPR